jgi:cytochrome c peroxidase
VKNNVVTALGLSTILLNVSMAGAPAAGGVPATPPLLFPDVSGLFGTVGSSDYVNRRSAFFQSLGTNGRTCGTCHVPEQSFTLNPAVANLTFLLTGGGDPLFAPVDGANCPNAAQGDRSAHSLILQNGLFRISIPVPANAQFTITAIYDPYGCAITTDPKTGLQDISLYRRPLPATNLSFLSDVMIDGRETIAPLGTESSYLANLQIDLAQQASDATTGHAQATNPPTDAQLADIVNFEMAFYTAQAFDWRAGPLMMDGAQGGPEALSAQEFYPGMNDARGADPTGAAFNVANMTLFAAWTGSTSSTWNGGQSEAARAAIAAGENIFNTATLNTGNGGVTHCANCHDTPNIGNHSLSGMFDVGASHSTLANTETNPQILAALAQLSSPNLPVYMISGCPSTTDPTQTTMLYTSDPGRALITGKCSDVSKVKVPVLRSLAARAPYFHNGSAANLTQVVNFYNQRFQIGLTMEQVTDLVAFLSAL